MKTANSGKIRIENDTIYWDCQNKILAEISLAEISIFGEYSTSDGPFVDDWYFAFVNKNGNWKKISCYVEDIDPLLQFLSAKLGFNLKHVSLANSSAWNSFIHYPLSLKSEKLFKIEKNTILLADKIHDWIAHART